MFIGDAIISLAEKLRIIKSYKSQQQNCEAKIRKKNKFTKFFFY